MELRIVLAYVLIAAMVLPVIGLIVYKTIYSHRREYDRRLRRENKAYRRKREARGETPDED